MLDAEGGKADRDGIDTTVVPSLKSKVPSLKFKVPSLKSKV